LSRPLEGSPWAPGDRKMGNRAHAVTAGSVAYWLMTGCNRSPRPKEPEMRRLIVSMSTLVAAVVAMATAAPAAFAMRVDPAGGASATVQSTHSGIAGWEIALITVLATVAVLATTAFVLGLRRRHGLRPVTS